MSTDKFFIPAVEVTRADLARMVLDMGREKLALAERWEDVSPKALLLDSMCNGSINP